jgi:rhodanese-related sulfurtransferase
MRSIAAVLVLTIMGIGIPAASFGADFTLISKTELKAMMDKDDLVILDVRSSAAWEGSNKKITSAVRENAGKVSEWMQKYPKETKLVLYCS